MVATARALGLAAVCLAAAADAKSYTTKSGILPWVDPATSDDAQTYTTSRGETWTLTMSEEFNTPNRSFKAGKDHMWVSMEMADGVNSALEYYSHNMTTTECDDDDNCYFQIQIEEAEINETVWNSYTTPPGYEDITFYYRSGMVQSWNKFCFQGGAVTVRAQLPGAVTNASGNPDVETGSLTVRAANIGYYPTWPGIWLMGNLGRAIFSSSTARMWPFTYNECNETIFSSQNQRISACDDSPGHGLNANQGRGAPEIDILEGGGTAISTSIQVGPGMPDDFRLIPDNSSEYCFYGYSCTTEGANNQDVPTAYYKELRGHVSWYQGLRYGPNNVCDSEEDLIQTYATINASLTAGITENACTMELCPASYDVHSDLSYINGTTTRWGINTKGACFPKQNAYTGAYLCSAGNTDSECTASSGSTSDSSEFAYQMDAISANWEVQMAAYLDWLEYTVEWVMGDDGYIRWIVGDYPIFEITADVLTNPPQNTGQLNPKKTMIEEPMYIIFNVALSSSWGSTPPNAGSACRGDGSSSSTNDICDSFPMYMKIDYIRLYQDTSSGTSMAIGCDPSSHPTATWIEDHIDEYTDTDNPYTEVSGMALCETDDDCTIDSTIITGSCESNRCTCASTSWTGPRCTEAASTSSTGDSVYGPPLYVSVIVAAVAVGITLVIIAFTMRSRRKSDARLKEQVAKLQMAKEVATVSIASGSEVGVKSIDAKEAI
jgi:beta-glucanase (GH16 family)